MPFDTVEQIEGSIIQHGPHNKRIYLMKLGSHKASKVLKVIHDLAKDKNYTKIFAKIPQSESSVFLKEGYVEEAKIPDFFGKNNDCLFVSKYFSDQRAIPKEKDKLEAVLELAKYKANVQIRYPFYKIELRKAKQEDAKELALLYKKVFPSYPFPIHDSKYIRDTMKMHFDYYIMHDGRNIVAASSAEKDYESMTVEMTDFATLPQYRKKGFSYHLLTIMEEAVRADGFKIAYTIACALSYGMNITFAKKKYKYAGTLYNNTHISGNIESMNVWYKRV